MFFCLWFSGSKHDFWRIQPSVGHPITGRSRARTFLSEVKSFNLSHRLYIHFSCRSHILLGLKVGQKSIFKFISVRNINFTFFYRIKHVGKISFQWGSNCRISRSIYTFWYRWRWHDSGKQNFVMQFTYPRV